MNFTGERPTLDKEVESSRLRYKSILPYVVNKKILDYGCGMGLGSYMMSFFSNIVFGYDLNKEAIKEANKNFQRPNLFFLESLSDDVLKTVDIAVAVEVIEHIEKEELDNLLKHMSSIIPEIACTTPEGVTMPYQPTNINKRKGFHIWHYTIQELFELFGRYYSFIEVYGHLFDPKISKYTSYVIYASNKINWKDEWIKNAKFLPGF